MKTAIFWTEKQIRFTADQKNTIKVWVAETLSDAYEKMRSQGFTHARCLDLDSPEHLHLFHPIPTAGSSCI